MARWQPVPIVGGAYSDDTRPWSCQDTVNYLPVKAERPGGRSGELLRCVPGMSVLAIVGTGPIRGSRDVEGKLFVVSGRKLYRVYADSVYDEIGTIPGVGRVSITHNQITGGNEVFIGNGASGYVYNTVTEVLAQVTDEGFPGAKSADFVDGYIAAVEPLGRFWFHSNLAAATDYNTLDRYEAEGSPDKIVGLIVSHGEVLVLSERTGEFFTNTGAATGTFQRMDGTSLEVGCASAASIAKVDNSPFWLGNDGIVYRLNGYSAVPISTIPMSQAISRCNLSKAFATVYESRGHKVYYLTFQDGQTWGYDVVTGEWHRRESFGLDRWRLNTLTKWNNVWIGGDFSGGTLYQVRWGHMAEGSDPLVRRKVSGVLHDNQNRVTVNAIELVFDSGNAEAEAELPIAPFSISGDLADALVGEAGTYQYASTGGRHALTFTISSGSLPPGATMDSSGLVTYAYTAASGVSSWTVLATDSDGRTAALADTANVSAVTLAWTSGTISPTQTLFDVEVEAGVYMLAGQNDQLLRSTDGTAWADVAYTAATGWASGAPIANIWHDSGDVWYMAISGAIAKSLDAGLTWALATAPRYTLVDRSVSEVAGVRWAGSSVAGTTRIFQLLSADAGTDIVYGADYGRPTCIAYLGGKYLVGTDAGNVLAGDTLAGAVPVHTGSGAVGSFAYLDGVWLASCGPDTLRATNVTAWASIASGTVGGFVSAGGYFYRGLASGVDRSTDGLAWEVVSTHFSGSGTSAWIATDGSSVLAAVTGGGRTVVGTA